MIVVREKICMGAEKTLGGLPEKKTERQVPEEGKEGFFRTDVATPPKRLFKTE